MGIHRYSRFILHVWRFRIIVYNNFIHIKGYVVSDRGALGKCTLLEIFTAISNYAFYSVENIMNQHHYTKTAIETVTAAVNAGVCLEDASTENNILSLAGEAVKQVTA